DQHMYPPLVIFDGERGQLVSAVLRPGNAHAARGAMGVIRRVIRRLKQRFPHAQIVVRGDSAFAVPRVLRMLEELDWEFGGIAYVFGLAQNAVLLRFGAAALSEALLRFQGSRPSVPVNPLRQQTRHFCELVQRMMVRPYSLPVCPVSVVRVNCELVVAQTH